MNFNVKERTILLVKHGSHAYGLNVPTSDVDMKGVAIEPLEYHFGFNSNFEQSIELVSKGHPIDKTVYSLKKFSKLAADGNPNIIEVLFGDDDDVVDIDDFGAELRGFRNAFLSTRVHHTFSGYAHSQLKRIKTHRNWLLNPPKEPPSRKDFGLRNDFAFNRTEMGAFQTVIEKDELGHELSNEALALYTKERAYQTMVTQWSQYQEWKRSRNPARAEMEAKFGFDGKHGMHLLRLMRMSVEIMSTGKVNVKRHDRDELLAVRYGERSYESVVEEAERLETESKSWYDRSPLPKKPDINKIDAFIVDMTHRYIKKNG